MNQEVQTRNASESVNRAAQQQPKGAAAQQYAIPPVDVFEDESGITVLADLPGATRDRLGVRVDGDQLLVEATVEAVGPPNMQLVYGEAQVAAYRRQFTLSRELDASHIDAQLKDGVLQLRIPRAEEARPRRIQVNVG